jgi:chitodextrinase
LLLIAVIGALLAPSVANAAPPTISSVSPMSAATDSTVTISGTNFTGANLVSFYDYPTTYTVVSSTQISAKVPKGTPSPGRWRVQTADGLAVYDPLFTVTNPTPLITSVSPMSGPVGSTVTITGSNFNVANLVSFFDSPTTYTVVSPTQITARVPGGTPPNGRWRVGSPNGTAVYQPKFTATSTPPTITSVSPMSGPAGSTVTLTGTNFTGADLVSFYDYPTSYTVVSATQIRASVPSGTPSPGRWRVRNPSGTATYSSLFSISLDTTAPTTPTGLAATGQTQTSITVAWTGSTDNVGVTGYGRYRNNTLMSSGTGTSTTFGGLACGTSYTLAVDAYDAAGNRSAKATVTAATNACTVADTTPPSLMTNQQVSTTQTTILMTWGPSTDNVGVAGYRAYLNGAVAGTTTSLSYTYAGLTCGTTYTVALEAYDAAGNVSDKAFATGPATTQACAGDTQPPTAPTNLVASSTTTTSVTLSWNASLDNVGVAGYQVYRGTTAVGSGTWTTYTVSGLTCGTTYTLSVDAYDAAGNRSTKAALTTSTSTCSSSAAQCADAQDNDADGKVDMADPGCSGSSDTSESPDPTPPPPSPTGTVAPGQSWQSAYNAAPALGVVRVLAGTHPDVTLSGTKQVTFLGDEGAIVRSLDLSAPVTIENVDIDTGSTHSQFNGANPRVPGIVFKNVNISGDAPSIHVWSTDFVWDGGVMTHRAVRLCGLDSGVPIWLNNDRATIQNFTFNPWREDNPACMHGEDIRVQGGDDIVIRNVLFRGPTDAGSGHVFVTNTGTGDSSVARRLRMEGNIFEPLIGSYAIQVIDRINTDGWVIMRNRFDQPPLVMTPIASNAQLCGNTGQVSGAWAAPCP